jgi:hypothetical protein
MSAVTLQKKHSISPENLSSLALAAATELDRMGTHPKKVSTAATHELAERLRSLFQPNERPQLPPETIGLVCGLVEDWSEQSNEGGYEQSRNAAWKIADLLDAARSHEDQIDNLVKFCLSLFYSTQPKAVIHDIPQDHEGILSMC